MATELDMARVRAYVTDLLKKNKALTEREVKAAIGKMFKVKPQEVGAAAIRQVRKRLGIDRPRAIAHAKALLAKDPLVEAKKVIAEVADRFGIRIGAPDVSRMRSRKVKAARRTGRRPAKAVAAVAAAPAAERPTRIRRAGRAAKARPATPAVAGRSMPTGKGEISVVFNGKGKPQDLAAFFMTLGK